MPLAEAWAEAIERLAPSHGARLEVRSLRSLCASGGGTGAGAVATLLTSGVARGSELGSGASEPLDLPWDTRRRPRRAKRARRHRRIRGLKVAIALGVLAALFVSGIVYLGNWPPDYAIESNSMQHGPGDHLGFLNAGDIVFARKLPTSAIVTYVAGTESGYSTYGEAGDVLVYYPNGQGSATPIIHRAIIFFVWTGTGGYNATDLGGLPCSNNSTSVSYYVTQSSGPTNHCADSYLGDNETLSLYHFGGRTSPLQINMSSPDLGNHSGFLTLGDNNSVVDQAPTKNGTPAISSLVEPGWVVGVACGLIPWFGALQLSVFGDAGDVSNASWAALQTCAVTGVLLVVEGALLAVVVRRTARSRSAGRRRAGRVDTGSPDAAPSPAGADVVERPKPAALDVPRTTVRPQGQAVASSSSAFRSPEELFPVARLGPRPIVRGPARSPAGPTDGRPPRDGDPPPAAPRNFASNKASAAGRATLPTDPSLVRESPSGMPEAAHESERRSHFTGFPEEYRRPPRGGRRGQVD
jgi:signal peptidase I